jgi:amidase
MSNYSRRTVLKGAAAMSAFAPFFNACAPASVSDATPDGAGFVDGVRTAQLIANGEMTSLEATEAAISRAEAVNDKINAIATPGFDAARDRAARAPAGAFGGVPTFIKDLADWKGLQSLMGSRAFVGNIASEDGPLAKVWRDELGVVTLGKSTSPEMGLISSTEPLVTGPTRNPWNLDHIPGGSSGGAAALTAARVVPFAHASDGGGSIRIPAACCGLFGLKPSHLASPIGRPNQEGNPVNISVDMAVTQTVRDTAALFAATARLPGQDKFVSGPATKRLRIAYAPTPATDSALDPSVLEELNRTAELCRSLGHEVIDYTIPLDGDEFGDKFLLYWSAGAAQFAQAASAFSGKPPSPEILEPWTLGLAQNFLSRATEMDATIAYLQDFKSVYHDWFASGGFDVLLTPTVAAPAPKIGTQNPDGDFETVMKNVLDFAAYTSPMNVSGAASMSMPLGMSPSGLPIASMFSGRQGDELMLLALAYELEEARPWIERRPPVVA